MDQQKIGQKFKKEYFYIFFCSKFLFFFPSFNNLTICPNVCCCVLNTSIQSLVTRGPINRVLLKQASDPKTFLFFIFLFRLALSNFCRLCFTCVCIQHLDSKLTIRFTQLCFSLLRLELKKHLRSLQLHLHSPIIYLLTLSAQYVGLGKSTWDQVDVLEHSISRWPSFLVCHNMYVRRFQQK